MKILAQRGYGEHMGSEGHLAMNRPSGRFYESGDPKLEPCPAQIPRSVVDSVISGSASDNDAADSIEALLLGAAPPEPQASRAVSQPPPQKIDADAVALLVEKRAVDKLMSTLADIQKQHRGEMAKLRQDLAELAVAYEKRLKKIEERVGRGPGRPPKTKPPAFKPEGPMRSGAEVAAEIEALPAPEADPYANDPT